MSPSDAAWQQLISALHASGRKAALAITGGGSGAVGRRFRRGVLRDSRRGEKDHRRNDQGSRKASEHASLHLSFLCMNRGGGRRPLGSRLR